MANENGSGNTAIVAIVLMVLLVGALVWFIFLRGGGGGAVEAPDGPDVEVDIGTN